MEQREYPRASESSLRRTDGWRLLTCPVELLRWPGPGGGVAEPAGRVTWRPRATSRRAVQSPWTGRLSPRRGCPKRRAADPTWSTRRCAAASATPQAVAIASPSWPRPGWARCVRRAPRVSGSGPTCARWNRGALLARDSRRRRERQPVAVHSCVQYAATDVWPDDRPT